MPFAPLTSRLVGRSVEMAILVGALESAAAGRGKVVVIEGEAGSGKTRLLDELRGLAVVRGFDVAGGACDELDVDRPCGPLIEAFALDATSLDPERVAVAQMLTGDAGVGPATDLRYRIVEQVVALVERLTAASPLVVAIEDVHWADAMTLRVVRALARTSPHLPLALFVTRRPYPRVAEIDRLVADLTAEDGAVVTLATLDPTDVGDLAAEVAGAPVGPRLSAHLAGTGGNPLFIIELVGALRDEGALGVDAGGRADTEVASVPSTVHAAITRRLGFLPFTTMEVLKVAAVLGTRFGVDELAAVMETTSVRLLADLEVATAAGVLGDAGGALAFRHELIRDGIYQQLAPPIRKGLHRQAARALAGLGAPPDQVADHLFTSAAPGDAEAVEWLARAGRGVAARSPATAVTLLERAVELADANRAETDALVSELAPLLIQTGRAGDAARLSRQVLDRSPAPVVEVGLRRALGEVLWTLGWLEPALGELDAVADVPGVAEAHRVGPAALAANIRVFLGEPVEAVRQARRALDTARLVDDHFAVSLALQTLAVAAAAEGRVEEALTSAADAVATTNRSTQSRAGQLHPHLYYGVVLIDADRLTEAEATLQEGRRRAEERGAVVWLPLYHWGLALRRVLTGDWDDALAEVEVGLAVADEVGTRLHVPFLHGIAAWIALQRGDLTDARASLEEALQEFLVGTTKSWQMEAAKGIRTAGARWPMEWGLWIAGLVHEAEGDEDEALTALEDAWAVSLPLRYLVGHRFFAPDLVRVALAAGARDLAERVTAEVEEGARRSDVATAAAVALRCRGLVGDDADTLLAAVREYRAQPAAVELAFALEEAGGALAREGRGPEAISALEEAVSVFEQAGATRVVARIEAALRSLGVRRRRPASRRRATAGWDSLTPTELVVARLAAEGLTNRQVAERLFVSRRTVETHMAHVFAKLGLSSRAQLGAEVARRT